MKKNPSFTITGPNIGPCILVSLILSLLRTVGLIDWPWGVVLLPVILPLLVFTIFASTVGYKYIKESAKTAAQDKSPPKKKEGTL